MSYDSAYDLHLSRITLEKIQREQLYNQTISSNIATSEFKKATANALTNFSDDIRNSLETSVSSKIGELEWITERGFDQVSEIFSFGMSEIIWHLEQSNKILTDILTTLKAPRKTEADEMRIRGNELFRNGLNARSEEDSRRWMNLSLDAYKKCIEINPVDFSAFYSMGIIQFFELKDPESAVKSFRDAAVLAEPYSRYYASLAWLHLGYLYRCMQNIDKAYEYGKQALELNSDWAEIHFQCAVYAGMLHRITDMKQHLLKAISINPKYWFRAITEPDLSKVGNEVRQSLDEIRQTKNREAKKYLENAANTIQGIISFFSNIKGLNTNQLNLSESLTEPKSLLGTAESFYNQGTYIELLKSIQLSQEVLEKCVDAVSTLENKTLKMLEEKKYNVQSDLYKKEQQINEVYESQYKKTKQNKEMKLRTFDKIENLVYTVTDWDVGKYIYFPLSAFLSYYSYFSYYRYESSIAKSILTSLKIPEKYTVVALLALPWLIVPILAFVFYFAVSFTNKIVTKRSDSNLDEVSKNIEREKTGKTATETATFRKQLEQIENEIKSFKAAIVDFKRGLKLSV